MITSPRRATATVLRVSRRRAVVLESGGAIVHASVLGKHKDLCVGDHVSVEGSGDTAVIASLNHRKNLLRRSYFGRTKSLAANLDHLFVVTAGGPLFNIHFIDRALVAAEAEGIPASLIINKIDLGQEIPAEVLATYERITARLFMVSCRSGEGMPLLAEFLEDTTLNQVIFCGVSGVGKSSLLNRLVPEADRRVGEVSEKTGQGKQTTSVALGVPLDRGGQESLIVIDSPGLQNFGLTHLSPDSLMASMPDIRSVSEQCAFRDCRHLCEPSCAVQDAVKRNVIVASRYESYVQIEKELRNAERMEWR